jgi:CelD/BcsL family acetyltransferase involved in cellulose biosynthesis
VNGSAESDPAISLLALVRQTLTSRQVVFLEGVPRESPLDRALVDRRLLQLFRVVQIGAGYERRLILLPDDFDVYLKSLSRHTRQNLRTGNRKLATYLGADPKLLSFTAAAEMPEFVRKAVAISRKTYQWHLLGLGLRNAERLEHTLTAMAKRGWTKCYLLECGGIATAFMIGYQYRGTYYYVDVGFDPDWETWSVGTMLHQEVLRDLIGSADRPRWFDFSSGSGPQKERFSNQSRAEVNFLLVPRSLRGLMLVWTYQGFATLSDYAVRLLDKLQLKAAVKRIIRRSSTRKANE